MGISICGSRPYFFLTSPRCFRHPARAWVPKNFFFFSFFGLHLRVCAKRVQTTQFEDKDQSRTNTSLVVVSTCPYFTFASAASNPAKLNMAKQASANFLRALAKLGQQFVKNNLAVSASCKAAKPSKPWAARQPSVQAKAFKQEHLMVAEFD